jgi:hypothetical protein
VRKVSREEGVGKEKEEGEEGEKEVGEAGQRQPGELGLTGRVSKLLKVNLFSNGLDVGFAMFWECCCCWIFMSPSKRLRMSTDRGFGWVRLRLPFDIIWFCDLFSGALLEQIMGDLDGFRTVLNAWALEGIAEEIGSSLGDVSPTEETHAGLLESLLHFDDDGRRPQGMTTMELVT